MHSKDFKDKVYSLQDGLFRLAYSMLHNREEAEDIVQEIFLRLWSKKDFLDQLDSIKAYAFKITKNLCLDRLKLRKQVIGEVQKLNLMSKNLDPQQKTETDNLVAVMFKIIKMLPAQQQLIVHLRNVEGLSFEEIEEITEMSVNNIRVILSRARRSINEIYLKHFDNG